MLFSAPTFLFIFLPTLLVVYFLVPVRLRNAVLLVFSLAFYSLGESSYVLLMLAVIGVNYLAALGVCRFTSPRRRRAILGVGIAGSVLTIAVFKYTGFALGSLNSVLAHFHFPVLPVPHLALPVGISFYTFQAMSYLIDVYRGNTPPERNPFRVALYISLFPQLIAGPIVRYTTIADQITDRRVTLGGFASGAERFIIGLAKKLMVADVLGQLADHVFSLPAGSLTCGVAWIGVLSYTGQIYFDFSGYSDMAIGLGRMFGFQFNENFNYPYISRSVTEFWRRWHISLSTWFRDYLYIPLGGNRNGSIATYRNLWIVFLVCGLWHGAAWTFVAWGLYHGTFLVIERIGFRRVLERTPAVIAWAYTFLVVTLGWVLFRAESFGQAASMAAALADRTTLPGWQGMGQLGFSLETAVAAICAVVGSFPVYQWLTRLADRYANLWVAAWWQLVRVVGLAAMVVWLDCLSAMSTHNPFIYFRF